MGYTVYINHPKSKVCVSDCVLVDCLVVEVSHLSPIVED